MQTEFHVSNGNDNFGPFTLAEIVSKLGQKEIAEGDYIFVEEQSDWIALNEFGPIKKRLEVLKRLKQSSQNKEQGSQNREQSLQSIEQSTKEERTKEELTKEENAKEPVALEAKNESTGVKQPALEAVSQTQITKTASPSQNEASQVEKSNQVERASQIDKSNKIERASQVEKAKLALQAEVNAIAASRKNTIKIVNGRAIVEMCHEVSEKLEIKLSEESNGVGIVGLKEIVVHSGLAVSIDVSGPEQMSAGETSVFTLVARDQYGNVDTSYNYDLKVESKSGGKHDSQIRMVEGRGEFSFKTIRAEKIDFMFTEISERSSKRLSFQRSLLIMPGPAVQIIVETPEDAKVGDPFKVVFRAVDQFGNFVSDFNGEVNLEVVNDSSKRPNVIQSA